MTELKPAADEEPVGAFVYEPCLRGEHSFSWRQGIEPCRYCGEPLPPIALPVTPPRPLRVRVDVGPVGYLWLEWLGACARVAGIFCPEATT